MPRTQHDWDERYVTGNLPWDTQRHDRYLEQVVVGRPVAPCPAIDLGCGTGSNAIWLAQREFHVTAVDISPTAIKMARENGEREGVDVEFLVADILSDPLPNEPFAFAFDRGCFHSFDDPKERAAFAETVWQHLAGDGLWLSLIGSTDGPVRGVGPPRRSVLDIASAVEPRFQVLSLNATHFDSDQADPPQAWACLMRRRAAKD
jgi:methyl halide transferase